jgi:hypothetical protein
VKDSLVHTAIQGLTVDNGEDPNNPHLIEINAVIEIPGISGKPRQGTFTPMRQ